MGDINVNANINLALNTWYHIAAVRSGTTMTLYTNGLGGLPVTVPAQIDRAGVLQIGGLATTNYLLNGYIDELRISNVARWTGNFTPPGGPYDQLGNYTPGVVTPPVATHFSVAVPGTATVGSTFSIAVTALDASNNTVSGYTGTVHITSSDGSATLPSNSTLTSGSGTFSLKLNAAGTFTVTATDTVTGSITGTSSGIVASAPPPPATHFTVSAPGTATAGAAFSVTVTAKDASNATVPSYAGTDHFTSTDGSATASNATLSSGVGTFSVTLNAAGTFTVTATDTLTGTINGVTGNIVASAAPPVATHFGVSAPSNVTVGVAFNVTVTALDAGGGTVTTYGGTVHFTLTDGTATFQPTAHSAAGSGRSRPRSIRRGPSPSPAPTRSRGRSTAPPAASTPHHPRRPTSRSPSRRRRRSAIPSASRSRPRMPGITPCRPTLAPFTSPQRRRGHAPPTSALSSGVGTFTVKLNTVGTFTVTATDTISSSINGVSAGIPVRRLAGLAP